MKMENLTLSAINIEDLSQLVADKVHDRIKNDIAIASKKEQTEQLLTVQEAAQFLNLVVPTIYSKVSRGELPAMKRGKRLYFSNTELMEYLKEGRKKSNSELETEVENYLSNNKKS